MANYAEAAASSPAAAAGFDTWWKDTWWKGTATVGINGNLHHHNGGTNITNIMRHKFLKKKK